MRQQDAPDVGDIHRQKRAYKTAYGIFLSVAGLALVVWLPTEKESLRLTVGFLVVLLGGMMVSEQTVKDFWGLFGKLFPFGRGGG